MPEFAPTTAQLHEHSGIGDYGIYEKSPGLTALSKHYIAFCIFRNFQKPIRTLSLVFQRKFLAINDDSAQYVFVGCVYGTVLSTIDTNNIQPKMPWNS